MWEQRHALCDPGVPEAHASTRAETLQARLLRVVLRDVLCWWPSRSILGRGLKDGTGQSPSLGAHVLPAVHERLGKRKSRGDEHLVAVFGLGEVVSGAYCLD